MTSRPPLHLARSSGTSAASAAERTANPLSVVPSSPSSPTSSPSPASSASTALSPCAELTDRDPPPEREPSFYYFAYGSCMCPVDLQRTLGENTRDYVIGTARLDRHRLAFNRRSDRRNCGVLDIVSDRDSVVEGVLYRLPWRLSDRLDEREEIPTRGYQRERVSVTCRDRLYPDVRTYSVVNKLPRELAPNDWYFNVVLRGAVTCGLSEQYCWKLFEHMHALQQRQSA